MTPEDGAIILLKAAKANFERAMEAEDQDDYITAERWMTFVWFNLIMSESLTQEMGMCI